MWLCHVVPTWGTAKGLEILSHWRVHGCLQLLTIALPRNQSPTHEGPIFCLTGRGSRQPWPNMRMIVTRHDSATNMTHLRTLCQILLQKKWKEIMSNVITTYLATLRWPHRSDDRQITEDCRVSLNKGCRPRNNIEANLCHDNCLLHVLVSKDVMPHGVGERPRDVGTDIFRPESTSTSEKSNLKKQAPSWQRNVIAIELLYLIWLIIYVYKLITSWHIHSYTISDYQSTYQLMYWPWPGHISEQVYTDIYSICIYVIRCICICIYVYIMIKYDHIIYKNSCHSHAYIPNHASMYHVTRFRVRECYSTSPKSKMKECKPDAGTQTTPER